MAGKFKSLSNRFADAFKVLGGATPHFEAGLQDHAGSMTMSRSMVRRLMNGSRRL